MAKSNFFFHVLQAERHNDTEIKSNLRFGKIYPMQMHESSPKWEEFEASVSKIALYLKEEKYVTIH